MEKRIGEIYRHFKGVVEKISGVEMIISLEHGGSQEHFPCATCFDLDGCVWNPRVSGPGERPTVKSFTPVRATGKGSCMC